MSRACLSADFQRPAGLLLPACLQEGEVGAGDDIVKVGEAAEKMTVAEINALLYSSHHAPDRLRKACLEHPAALARGWRESLEALLKNRSGSGNAGLMPRAASHPAAPGFRKVIVTAVEARVNRCRLVHDARRRRPPDASADFEVSMWSCTLPTRRAAGRCCFAVIRFRVRRRRSAIESASRSNQMELPARIRAPTSRWAMNRR